MDEKDTYENEKGALRKGTVHLLKEKGQIFIWGHLSYKGKGH